MELRKKILIGSRGSELALVQARKVQELLASIFQEISFEIQVIKTEGDLLAKEPASGPFLTQGIFTKEIEEALLSNKIDLAVHSAKDLPTVLPEALQIGAVLERDDVRDAWVSRTGAPLSGLAPGSIVATGSPRRKAQLKRHFPHLKLIDIRGNVPTRLRKMKEGAADGLILAACGLERLKLSYEITEILEKEIMFPAVSQGAIAIEIRKEDSKTRELISKIHHEETFCRVEAERSLLRVLQGGCQVPVGVWSQLVKERLKLEGYLYSLDGKKAVGSSVEGSKKDASALGRELAARIKAEGGQEILDEIRRAATFPQEGGR